MATTATSNMARLRFIKESNFGETPNVGTSTDLRFTGESLNFNISTETSNEIRADRNVSDLIPVDVETSGDIDFELSFGTFDDFIAAALGGTWEVEAGGAAPSVSSVVPSPQNPTGDSGDTRRLEFSGTTAISGALYVVKLDSDVFRYKAKSDDTVSSIVSSLAYLINKHESYVASANGTELEIDTGAGDAIIEVTSKGAGAGYTLKNGTNLESFSIEKGFTDINQFLLYTGMAVNGMNLTFDLGAIITGSFSFMGSMASVDGTTQVPAAGAPGTPTEVMNAVSNFADLEVDGTPYPCGISAVSLSTEAGLRDQKALGKMGACSVVLGQFSATGSFTMYMADGSMYDKYLKNTPFSLTWKVKDSDNNEYVFTLPKVKITSANPVAGGLDTDVTLDVEYQAIYDPISDCAIEIFKSA